jgi:hypothetical protein
MFRPAEGPLGVDDPVVVEERPQLGQRQEVAVELKLPTLEGVAKPATNLPRKTRLSTAMGRKKERPGSEGARRAEIQLA